MKTMIKRLIILISLSSISYLTIAQTYCDCKTIEYKKDFNGYCNEYLDNRFNSVKKNKAQFKMFVYYEKGVNLRIYPFYYKSRGAKKIILNGKEVVKSDSIYILNGLIEFYNRLGTKINMTNFIDGKIIKDVNFGWGIFRSLKKVGFDKQVHEISEFYYLTDKIEAQIISYRYNGFLRYNVYAVKEDVSGKWNFRDTTNILSKDPLKLNK